MSKSKNITKKILTNVPKTLVILIFSLFTTTSFSQTGPAGIGNCVLWLKADAGTMNGATTVTTTGALTQWQDQSGNAKHASATTSPFKTQDNSSPEKRMNYNPVVVFDQPTDRFQGPYLGMNGTTSLSEFYVFQSAPAPNPVANYLAVFALGTDDNGAFNSAHRVENSTWSGSYTIYDDAWPLLTDNHLASAGSSDSYYTQSIKNTIYDGTTYLGYANGTQVTSKTTGLSINAPGNYKIGDCEPVGAQSDFSAGEIIIFSSTLNNNQRRKVDTYLAIKYGITLSHPYRKANNGIIYSLTGYDFNIIGLGRQDNSGLYQKQSHTIDDTSRIYLSNLQTTNLANGGTFAADKSFIIMGDNQGLMRNSPAANAEVPGTCGLYSRLEREWKVTRTNNTEDFSIDFTLNPGATPASVVLSELRLLVDNDGDFSNGGTTCYFNGDASGTVITYSNPVITVSGISTSHIDNNNTRYITIGSTNITTPLPVELLKFETTCNNVKPELTWITASEINNDYFTIERSIDAVNFEPIATVSGNANKSTTSHYSWTDGNSINGAVYYRLKQTDFNGVVKYLGVRTITCEQSNDISIFPNPFENYLTIQLSENTIYPVKIEVLDYLGKRVHEQIIDNSETTISLESYSAGSYFVKVVKQTTMIVEPVLKMK